MNLQELNLDELQVLKPKIFYIGFEYSDVTVLLPIKFIEGDQVVQWDFENKEFMENLPDPFSELVKFAEKEEDIKFYIKGD